MGLLVRSPTERLVDTDDLLQRDQVQGRPLHVAVAGDWVRVGGNEGGCGHGLGAPGREKAVAVRP